MYLIYGNENKSHYPSRQLVACYAISIAVVILNRVNINNWIIVPECHPVIAYLLIY